MELGASVQLRGAWLRQGMTLQYVCWRRTQVGRADLIDKAIVSIHPCWLCLESMDVESHVEVYKCDLRWVLVAWVQGQVASLGLLDETSRHALAQECITGVAGEA